MKGVNASRNSCHTPVVIGKEDAWVMEPGRGALAVSLDGEGCIWCWPCYLIGMKRRFCDSISGIVNKGQLANRRGKNCVCYSTAGNFNNAETYVPGS